MDAQASSANNAERSFHPDRLKWGYFGLAVPQVWSYCVLHRPGVDTAGVSVQPLFFIALAAAMMLIVAVHRAVGDETTAKLLRWPASVLAALSAVVLALPLNVPSAGLTVAATLVGGIALAGMYLSWAPFFARRDIRNTVAFVFGGIAVGSVVKILIDIAPVLVGGVLLVALPFLSPVMLASAEADEPQENDKPRIYFDTARSSLPYAILAGVAVCAFVIGLAPAVAGNPAPTAKWMLSLTHHGLEILVSFAVIWWVFMFKGKLHFTNMWRVIVILVATALLLIPHIGSDYVGWALIVVAVTQTILVAVMWTMLADAAHHSSASPYVVFGFAWAAYALPVALGYLLGDAIAGLSDLGFIVALLSYALTVSAILLLNDRNFIQSHVFSDLDITVPEESSFKSIDERCQELGEEKSLTKREIEVMKLLCKGRSKSYIAEALVISENTVRTHARHIYQKLDVHSKQDIMDMIGFGDE